MHKTLQLAGVTSKRGKRTCILGMGCEIPLKEKAHWVAFQPQRRLHAYPHIAQLHSSNHIITCTKECDSTAGAAELIKHVNMAVGQEDMMMALTYGTRETPLVAHPLSLCRFPCTCPGHPIAAPCSAPARQTSVSAAHISPAFPACSPRLRLLTDTWCLEQATISRRAFTPFCYPSDEIWRTQSLLRVVFAACGLTRMSWSGRKLMGPHSVGPQVCGNVRCSFSCLGDMSAAAACSPNASASPAPLCGHTTVFSKKFHPEICRVN